MSKYREALDNYNKLSKNSLSDLKPLLRSKQTELKLHSPNLLLEFNTLIVKYNKHLKEMATVEDHEVKQLARNFKALHTRVE